MKPEKIFFGILGLGCLLTLGSCSSKTYMATFAPEESGLNVVKITDESKNTVLGASVNSGFSLGSLFPNRLLGGNKKNGITWNTIRALSISPNGDELAYMTRSNKQQNIMVRKAVTGGVATQRTFRNVGDFSWGEDDNLYFIDINDTQNKICVINAHSGSLMRQLTSNNKDFDPVLSSDGEKVFFTRFESQGGPAIWSYSLSTGELTNCARGFHPAPIPNVDNEFICVRNSDKGSSEIWRVNYINGQETLLLSDNERGYTHPTVSPDGKWLLVCGNSVSSINKSKNLDIFAIMLDGSNLIQLTYHPGQDVCPQWSADGKSVYFLSDRATEDQSYNVWKMNFRL